jgi:hypothetical protein
MNWKLISEKTGEEINVGDEITTISGERVRLVGVQPPHRPGTTGKVFVMNRNRRDSVYYAAIVGCRFERSEQPKTIDGQYIIEE